MCIYMYVYVCICMYIYICMCIYIYVYILGVKGKMSYILKYFNIFVKIFLHSFTFQYI